MLIFWATLNHIIGSMPFLLHFLVFIRTLPVAHKPVQVSKGQASNIPQENEQAISNLAPTLIFLSGMPCQNMLFSHAACRSALHGNSR